MASVLQKGLHVVAVLKGRRGPNAPHFNQSTLSADSKCPYISGQPPSPFQLFATDPSDLLGSPDACGVGDPLPGVDSCVNPDGRAPRTSRAELEERRVSKAAVVLSWSEHQETRGFLTTRPGVLSLSERACRGLRTPGLCLDVRSLGPAVVLVLGKMSLLELSIS